MCLIEAQLQCLFVTVATRLSFLRPNYSHIGVSGDARDAILTIKRPLKCQNKLFKNSFVYKKAVEKIKLPLGGPF